MGKVDYEQRKRDRWSKIEQRRRSVGWTREQLARSAHLSVHTVNKCANPKRLHEVYDNTLWDMEEAIKVKEAERAAEEKARKAGR